VASVRRVYVCLFVCLSRFILTLLGRTAHTQRDFKGAVRDAASVHFLPSITRMDILVQLGAGDVTAVCSVGLVRCTCSVLVVGGRVRVEQSSSREVVSESSTVVT